jgi:hypothetical protein
MFQSGYQEQKWAYLCALGIPVIKMAAIKHLHLMGMKAQFSPS